MDKLTTCAPCRYCSIRTWLTDDQGPVHRCCRAWRAVILAGYPCPACTTARAVVQGRSHQAPRRLPATLPDGRPFTPLHGEGPDPDAARARYFTARSPR